MGQKGGEAGSVLEGLVDFGIGIVWLVDDLVESLSLSSWEVPGSR